MTNRTHNIRVQLGKKPRFVIQPRTREVCAGELFVLNADAESNVMMEYRWKRNGILLPDRTNSFALQFDTAGRQYTYQCIVNSECGSDTSEICTITTTAKPTITQQPPKTLSVPQLGYLRLAVGAFASRALKYTWVKDGNELQGSNSPLFEIASVLKRDEGRYWVKVMSECDTINSDTTVLTVTIPTSVNDEATEWNITVMPNPASESCTIDFGNLSQVKNVTIRDIIGREVFVQPMNNEPTLTIDTRDFMSGTYHLVIQTMTGQTTIPFRVVK